MALRVLAASLSPRGGPAGSGVRPQPLPSAAQPPRRPSGPGAPPPRSSSPARVPSRAPAPDGGVSTTQLNAVLAPERVVRAAPTEALDDMLDAVAHANDLLSKQLEDLLAAPSAPPRTAPLPQQLAGAMTRGHEPQPGAKVLSCANDLQRLTDQLSSLCDEVQMEMDALSARQHVAAALELSAGSPRPASSSSSASSSARPSTSAAASGLALLPPPSAHSSGRGQRRKKNWVVATSRRPVVDDAPQPLRFGTSAHDSLGVFMGNFERTKTLSKAEEQRLAAAAKDYLQLQSVVDLVGGMMQRPPSMAELAAVLQMEEGDLKLRMSSGSQARMSLAQRNYRLVASVAKRFRGRGSSMPDLILAGMDGLMTAIRKFRPEAGYKLSTYSTWWIRQAIQTLLASEAHLNIKLPRNVLEALDSINAASTRLRAADPTRPPSLEALSRETGLTPLRIQRCLKARPLLSPTHLDAPLGTDAKAGGREERLELEAGRRDAEEEAMLADVTATVDDIMSSLDEPSRALLRMRYESGDVHGTRKDRAKQLVVSPSRLLQLEDALLQQLRERASARLQELRDAPMDEPVVPARSSGGHAKKTAN